MAIQDETRVLLIEPETSRAAPLIASLERDDMLVTVLDGYEKAFNFLETERIHALVARAHLSGVDAFRLMRFARERNPELCVVALCESAEQDLGLEAMRQGADDFQLLPYSAEKLRLTIARARVHQAEAEERFRLNRRLDARYGLGALAGQSRHIAQAYAQIRTLAPASMPIIIVGEPGTGKDLVAQIIHRQSTRAGEPFVRLDGAAVPPDHLERVCFGHVAEAFPGARDGAAGLLEQADGGTLYIEGLREPSPGFVDTLLDVLRTGTVTRIGSTSAISADVRLIVAVEPGVSSDRPTGQLLGQLDSGFQAATIALPPLRQREGDVAFLASHFANEIATAEQRPAPSFTGPAMDLLSRYAWPGNVRELKSVIESMMSLGREALDINDIPPEIRSASAPSESEVPIPVGTSMHDAERLLLLETWKSCGYDKEKTAEILGIGLRTVYRKLKQYGEM